MLALRIPAPLVREAPAIYRPRRPQEGLLYRLLEDRFEEFALLHEERFEREDCLLRPVVRRVVKEFLEFGMTRRTASRGCAARSAAPSSSSFSPLP